MEFYNVKTRSKVNIPDNELKKQKFQRTTSGGKQQTRYAVVAETGGTKLFRFVDEKTYQSLKVPEIS